MTNDSGLDIFITISLKYPELNAVKYQVDKDQIILEVALNGKTINQKIKSFTKKTVSHLSLFHKLANKKPTLLELDFKEVSGITFLRFLRDIKSLTEEEIELFFHLLMDDFSNSIIRDNQSIDNREIFKKKVKLIKVIRENSSMTRFFAYRKEGKVFVFNK
jgi:hypothetical protein